MAGWTVVPNGDTSAWKPVTKPAAPPAEQPGFLENLGHAFGIGKEEEEQREADERAHPIRNGLKALIGGPALPVAEGLYGGAKRSIGEISKGIDSLSDAPKGQHNWWGLASHAISAVPFIGPAIDKMAEESPPTHPGQSYASQVFADATPGNIGTALGTAAQVAPLVLGGLDMAAPGRTPIAPIAAPLRRMALGDPNAAALKGLRVGPASAKSLSTLKSVEGARPYMQGVQSLADAQARVPAAKAEIWNPYKQAIDKIGGKQVMGPDGPTTVGDLENERLQISANLRTLKSGSPEGIQLAAQKGMNQADLLAREKAVQSALDPHLAEAGIDPKLIRGTFGDVAQVGGRLSGKSTLAEPSQPYGFGRMLNMRIDNPRSWLGEPAQGVRDLAAGRPLWSGKPTDINIREAFRSGGPKPDFRAPASAMPRYTQPFARLEANVPGNAGYGEIDRGSMSGIPHPGPVVTPAPRVFARLPEITTPGEVQPMVRYAKPYVEPFDPHFKPVDLAEYRRMHKE